MEFPTEDRLYPTRELIKLFKTEYPHFESYYKSEQFQGALSKLPTRIQVIKNPEAKFGEKTLWKILQASPTRDPRPLSLSQQLKMACDALPEGDYTVKKLLERFSTINLEDKANPHACLDSFLTKNYPRATKIQCGKSYGWKPETFKAATWRFATAEKKPFDRKA
jgi:hypothetical protein